MQDSSKTKTKYAWEKVDALENHFHNPIVESYLRGDNFPNHLVNTSSTKDAIDEVAGHEDYPVEWRNQLADVILKQYASSNKTLDTNSLVFQNIQNLRKSTTVTVCTGQQIHIFLGPLFVIYKIMSCLAHAKEIKKAHPDFEVVPIFWMATEDHDFEEISSVKLYNQTYTWDNNKGGAVGRLDPKSLLPLVEEISQRIDDTPENSKFMQICRTAYSENSTFSLATRSIIHEMFGHTGLVILDPDDAILKQKFRKDIETDILHNACEDHLKEGISQMKKVGFKAPINTRPINHFHLSDGQRLRVETKDREDYSLVNGNSRYTRNEISQLIEDSPERFSPNALLRPLYQQRILPNIAYIAGGSEFIYWLELKHLFKESRAFFPKLFIRKSVFFVGSSMNKKLKDVGLNVDDLFTSEKAYVKRVVDIARSSDEGLSDVAAELKILFEDLSNLEENNPKFKLNNQFRKAKRVVLNELENAINSWQNDTVESDKSLSSLVKIKSKIYDPNFVQERNEFIINRLLDCHEAATESHFDTISYFDPKYIIVGSPH